MNRRIKVAAAVLAVCSGWLLTTGASARVTDAMIEANSATSGDVLSWGMGTRG